MVYTKGNIIETVDYNDFVGVPTGVPVNANKTLQPFSSDAEATLRVAAIYGVGYGQRGYGQTNIILPNVAMPELVKSIEWSALRTAILNCAVHQGTSTTLLPPVSLMEVGDFIIAHDGITDTYNLPQMIINIDNVANRFSVISLSSFASAAITRASTWTSTITCTLSATFTSENEARYFFNSGGILRLDINHPVGNGGSVAWSNIVDNYVGIIDFNYTTTTRYGSRGTASSIGYWDLTSTYQTIYNGTNIGDAPYTINDVIISAKTSGTTGGNGGNGTVVDFQIQLIDQHTSPGEPAMVAGANVIPTVIKTTALTISSPTWSGAWSGS